MTSNRPFHPKPFYDFTIFIHFTDIVLSSTLSAYPCHY